jgi:hypothetical protein
MQQKNTEPGIFLTTKMSWRSSRDLTNRNQFIPFVNERDGLGRLLPVCPKSIPVEPLDLLVSTKIPANPKKEKDLFEKHDHKRSNSYTAKSVDMKGFLIRCISSDKKTSYKKEFFYDPSLNQQTNKVITSRVTEDVSGAGRSSFVQSVHRRIQTYSFSKSVKKTIMDETIEKSKKQDFDYIDITRAHNSIHKKNSYLPDYSRTGKSLLPSQMKANLNHAYLMKILNHHDKERLNRFLKSEPLELPDV